MSNVLTPKAQLDPTLVDTTSAQTLTNKDLSSGTNIFPVLPYIDLTTNQSVAGVKTFTSNIVIGGVPSSVSSSELGLQLTDTNTSGSRTGIAVQLIAGAASSSSATYTANSFEVGTSSGNVNNFTGQLAGVGGSFVHRGNGVVSTVANLYAGGASITGTGSITTLYGLLVPNLSAAGTSYSIFTGTAQSVFQGLVGLNTVLPTHSLTLGSTTTGIASYNTSDQTTNYERVRGYWSSNQAVISTESGGTGTARDLVLGVVSGARALTISGAASASGFFQLVGASTSGAGARHTRLTGTFSATSGTAVGIELVTNYSGSGTQGYTALLINPNDTSTGSGPKLLADFQLTSASKASIDSTGKAIFLGGLKITNSSALGNVWTATDTVGNGSWQAPSGGGVTSISNVDGTLTISPTTGAVVASIPSSVVLAGSPTTTTQTAGDNSTKIATTAYTDLAVAAAVQGLSIKQSVQEATAGALPTNTYLAGVITITATGVLTVDGVTVALNDRVLVKNETTQANNGVYLCTTAGSVGVAAVLTRAIDSNTSAKIIGGFTFVETGTINANSGFVNTNTSTITIGTTAITYTQFSGAGEIIAGTGLAKSGNTLSIDTTVTVDKTTAQVLTNKDVSSGTNTFPTLNQNTTGSAATLTTARTLAGNSFNGSANVPFVNKFIVQGTTDAGLTGAQFLGVLATGLIKNTTTTGVLSIGVSGTDYSAGTSALATGILKSTTTTGALTIAVAADFPTLNQNTSGSAASFTGALAGDVTGTQGATVVGKINGTSLAGLATGILKNTTTTGVPSIAIASDFPTLNQSTTGSAATLTTPRTINGTSFDGSANIVIAPRTNTTASSATPAINTDTTDIFTITALAAAITSMTSSLTGTPVNGQKLLIRFKDAGTAQTIAWGTGFVSSGVATLLATTVISKTHLVGLVYDSAVAKWVCQAVDATGY